MELLVRQSPYAATKSLGRIGGKPGRECAFNFNFNSFLKQCNGSRTRINPLKEIHIERCHCHSATIDQEQEQ